MWEVANAASIEVSSSSSPSSSSSASPPASTVNHVYNRQRKPSRNFPGLVKRSHMGSLASIVTSGPRPVSYNRSASVSSSRIQQPRRPSSLHIPVTQSLSASSAMVSPILSVATRAINNNVHEAACSGSGLSYPPLIFPAAEFAPGNHLKLQQGRGAPTNAKGENTIMPSDHYHANSVEAA